MRVITIGNQLSVKPLDSKSFNYFIPRKWQLIVSMSSIERGKVKIAEDKYWFKSIFQMFKNFKYYKNYETTIIQNVIIKKCFHIVLSCFIFIVVV